MDRMPGSSDLASQSATATTKKTAVCHVCYRGMRQPLLGALVGALLAWLPTGVEAQDVEELFRKVNPSVVVIKARGRDVSSTRGLVSSS
jgi:hypothetical protein